MSVSTSYLKKTVIEQISPNYKYSETHLRYTADSSQYKRLSQSEKDT